MADVLVKTDEFIDDIYEQRIKNKSQKSCHRHFRVEDLTI